MRLTWLWLAALVMLLALLFAAPVHAQKSCDGDYRLTRDMLSQAEDKFAASSDAQYVVLERLDVMLRIRVFGAALGQHCSADELAQLASIRATLHARGLALTPEEQKAAEAAEEKKRWDAAVEQFNRDVVTLVQGK